MLPLIQTHLGTRRRFCNLESGPFSGASLAVTFVRMKPLLALIGLLLAAPALAQTADETAAKAVITQMFDGMKRADSTALKSLFLPGARLQSVVNKQGEVSVSDQGIDRFITSVGKAKAGALDERLSGMEVKVDGDLATVWTPYSFYYNGQQSHCGANAFTLVRMSGAWKIQHIIDTRRKCQ